MDVISLTQKLLRFNTINPPGNEKELAEFCGEFLNKNGFNVKYFEFAENRLSVVAEAGITDNDAPLVLSGHLDTVPLGQKEWSVDPFSGEIKDGKLYGRGSCDMKGGVAAIMTAAVDALKSALPKGGIRIILSASEENGCKGAAHLTQTVDLGKAKGVIIAEPTDNLPVCAHKGALYMWVKASGVTAHSSMPKMGVNAIYKAARAITKIENFKFDVEKDDVLGMPTINVGVVKGGLNINSVPDKAEFSIDVRSTTKIEHDDVLRQLQELLGNDLVLEPFVNCKPVYTAENDPFVNIVDLAAGVDRKSGAVPRALPYATDAAFLQDYYQAPTIILGPGEARMAHQTDEYCEVQSIENAVDIYSRIIKNL
jgi:succinyl-diaminopimelate desuccinylase